jgi:hypothetical protein
LESPPNSHLPSAGFRSQDSGRPARGFFLISESSILLYPECSNPQIVILHYENCGHKQPQRLVAPASSRQRAAKMAALRFRTAPGGWQPLAGVSRADCFIDPLSHCTIEKRHWNGSFNASMTQ